MTPKSQLLYTEPRTLYLRDSYGFVSKVVCTGETSRSWLTGPIWKPDEFKRLKANYTIVDQLDHDNFMWAIKHRNRIRMLIEELDPVMLKRVAALIGYKESEAS